MAGGKAVGFEGSRRWLVTPFFFPLPSFGTNARVPIYYMRLAQSHRLSAACAASLLGRSDAPARREWQHILCTWLRGGYDGLSMVAHGRGEDPQELRLGRLFSPALHRRRRT
jgi:hypothetical protein